MSPVTRLLRRGIGLPAPRTPRVRVVRDVAVPMPDGAVLRHDHHRPAGVGRGPVVLVRSPYGRAGWAGLVFGRLVAERGYQVVVQSVRGTAGSEGELSPFDEADDGVATVRWLVAQPWCDGRIATLGPSYLGITQWALAPEAGEALRAMGTLVTASQFRDQTYPGGAFSLDNALSWGAMMTHPGLGERLVEAVRHRVQAGFGTVPLSQADLVAAGTPIDFFQDWLREDDPDSAYWAKRSYAAGVGEVGRRGVAISMTGGWQDIFLPWQLADHAALRAAGARPLLRIGPWVHTTPAGMAAGIRDALRTFDETFGHSVPDDGARVLLELSGGGGERRLADWPPEHTVEQAFYLRTDHGLGTEAPSFPTRDDAYWAGTRIVYDPNDPTPAVGGPILSGRSGPRDQTALEARDDVVVFTGPVLDADLVALGPARATIHVRAEVEHLDVFVRVCDVDPAGRSVNVTDGIRRLRPGVPAAADDGTVPVEVELWPVGHRFAAGHRVRVQISGGAHPRFARHTGTGAPLGDGRVLVAREREVLHDAAHPSHVVLPVEPGH
ncbi:CocE/NonD family hydrolase [Actinomycetospora termitidis]|uniref:CocE/NonD family hydrolase n=1 Tax=Actinomycetospora termitidis TaxID=3053470 RepID=A0ABT7MC74_9PSEU|nr:CocE/NonD family hydrolase [Actinomycetospora sp. Odt1-22]MDL5157769.1 CocE/NonD family hydrolase [Actinomycetospora sp. Odt1-22]